MLMEMVAELPLEETEEKNPFPRDCVLDTSLTVVVVVVVVVVFVSVAP